MIHDDQWFEVWYCPGVNNAPHYILIVAPSVSPPERYLVYDPQLNYAVIYEGNDYESTRLWLEEDEFDFVSGRTFPDDGFPLKTNK